MLIGTTARNCDRALIGTPRPISQVRKAPATTASTMSLIDPPRPRRTFLTTARSKSAVASSRSAPIGTFKAVTVIAGSAATRAKVSAVAPALSDLRPRSDTTAATPLAAVRATSSAIPGWARDSLSADVTSSSPDGSGAGSQDPTERGLDCCASPSKITCKISMPIRPSIITWWVLLTIANRPPANPEISDNSQSGRVRSRGRLISRPTNSSSCWREPGFGNVKPRT